MVCMMEDALNQAAIEDDPVKRLVLVAVAYISVFNQTKIRKRKPFDSFIGETFELVTPSLKFVSEQIQHLPTPVSCFHCEGEGFIIESYSKIKPQKFTWGGGKGRLEIQQYGVCSIYFKKYDEHISL